MATTAQEQYESIELRPRVTFGKFRFVVPDPNYVTPNFSCHDYHEGSVIQPPVVPFTLEAAPSPSKASTSRFPNSAPPSKPVQQVTIDNDEVVAASDLDDSFDDDYIIFDGDPAAAKTPPKTTTSKLARQDSSSSVHVFDGEEENQMEMDSFDDDDEIINYAVVVNEEAELECSDEGKQRHDHDSAEIAAQLENLKNGENNNNSNNNNNSIGGGVEEEGGAFFVYTPDPGTLGLKKSRAPKPRIKAGVKRKASQSSETGAKKTGSLFDYFSSARIKGVRGCKFS